MLLFIETSTHDDYDKVVRYLLAHNVQMLSRDKVKMLLSADISMDFARQIHAEIDFDDLVVIGDPPPQ